MEADALAVRQRDDEAQLAREIEIGEFAVDGLELGKTGQQRAIGDLALGA